LCPQSWFDSPELAINDKLRYSVSWLWVSTDQVKSHLSKVDTAHVDIELCCDLFCSPELTPKSKITKYSMATDCFWTHAVVLFGLTDVEFLKNYFTLSPSSSPVGTSCQQLVEVFSMQNSAKNFQSNFCSHPTLRGGMKQRSKCIMKTMHLPSSVLTKLTMNIHMSFLHLYLYF
jgi:hypothetical protein